MLPQTYMNRSGVVLPTLFERFETTIQNTVVVYDDLALPLGKMRIRQKGSAGGHNGIKSLISTCGSDEFLRVRVGILPGPRDRATFAISFFRESQKPIANCSMPAEEAAARGRWRLCCSEGIEKAMAAFNGIDLRDLDGGPVMRRIRKSRCEITKSCSSSTRTRRTKRSTRSTTQIEGVITAGGGRSRKSRRWASADWRTRWIKPPRRILRAVRDRSQWRDRPRM